MDRERTTTVWGDFVKVMAVSILTLGLIAYWSHNWWGDQIQWVSTPQAVVPATSVESEYLNVVNEAAPGYMNASNEQDIVALGKSWCLSMRDGADPLDALAAVDEIYGDEAATFAATIMAAAHAFFCPEVA